MPLQRQKAMVQNLYGECMALEELLEESVNTLGPDARDILAQIRYLLCALSQAACIPDTLWEVHTPGIRVIIIGIAMAASSANKCDSYKQ